MCGIAAILFAPGTRPPEVRREIQAIFTRNLLFNEERGKDATGLAVVRADGQVRIHKAAMPASEFVRTPAYQDLIASLDDQTVLWLGHTRLPTKGDPANQANNHPILARYVLGVHNGNITNDDALFARWGYPRQAEVDSEIIFHLLSDLETASSGAAYVEQACRRMRLMEGQFTFLAVDVRSPSRLLVLKHHNPLCAHYHAPWQALIFSSRYIFLRKAFGKIVVTEALPHDTLLSYDARRLPVLQNRPAHTCALGV